MTNVVALRNENGLAGLAAFAQDHDSIAIAGDLLKFAKGKWYSGQEEFDPQGQHFLVNVREAYTGWTFWQDKKPVEHRLVRCSDYAHKAPREALGHTDKNSWPVNDRGAPQDPWQQSDRMVLRAMNGAQELYTFVSGSNGGRNAIAKMLGAVARSPQAKEGKMPVVVLEVGTYEHDDFGTIPFPRFRIIDWAYWDEADRPAPALAPAKSWDEILGDELPL
jgi:hypothetical protein